MEKKNELRFIWGGGGGLKTDWNLWLLMSLHNKKNNNNIYEIIIECSIHFLC